MYTFGDDIMLAWKPWSIQMKRNDDAYRGKALVAHCVSRVKTLLRPFFLMQLSPKFIEHEHDEQLCADEAQLTVQHTITIADSPTHPSTVDAPSVQLPLRAILGSSICYSPVHFPALMCVANSLTIKLWEKVALGL